ncbi:DUF3566 domain-containing protein [Leifsonia poae]|uniref:DUF3566 domain-containing protein n=1 Tax=Leifsonia poae TaxID=110933 RepID=A0A9W6H7S1_9MICO|nr:DUF3566 domain-containing protein [Leifsonia poae]GLJ75232.1 hypothetical protein GCM10017584_08060 [Leifsonia poae]
MARTRIDKRVTMRLVYIDFWSSLKLSFLVSLCVAAVTILVALLGWSVLDKTGIITSARVLFTDIGGDRATDLFAGLTFQGVLSFTLVVALLELIVVTALGAVFAALFNLASRVTGGARVKFANKD